MTERPATLTITAPADAWTNPDTGLREYDWLGRRLISVTSVQRVAGVPHGLHQWAISQVVERAVGQSDVLTGMLNRPRRPRERVPEKNRPKEAAAWLRSAATEERDRAAALGSAVHDAAAAGLIPGDIPDVLEVTKDGRTIIVEGVTVRARLSQYIAWLQTSRIRILAREFQVFALGPGYAGSVDLLGSFPSGRTAIVDLKTGESAHVEHVIQLAAYRGAEFVGRGGVVDERGTALLRTVTDTGILHLADDHWEYLSLRSDTGAHRAFLGLLGYAQWLRTAGGLDGLVAGRRDNRVSKAPEDADGITAAAA